MTLWHTEGEFQALRLAFNLPPSSYATMLIRELMKTSTSAAAQAARNPLPSDPPPSTATAE